MNFTPEFLEAVVDTLLPGLPATTRAAALPPASQVGVAQQLARHLATHRDHDLLEEALTAIIDVAGDRQAFIMAQKDAATGILNQIEQTLPLAFQALLFVVSADYYEAAAVLQAFGWPTSPPQPQGYSLPPFNEALLQPVKKRPSLWRPIPKKD